jgi:hypothetical protein
MNPDNAAAQRGAVALRQKGILPAIPVYPEPQRDLMPDFTHRGATSPQPSHGRFAQPRRTQAAPAPIPASASEQQSSYGTNRTKQELSGYFQYAAMELESNKSRQAVEKLLVGRGASPEVAKTVVQDAQYTLKKGRRAKYQKRMTRGFLWTIVGIIITCGTFVFADSLGGRFYLFYGAIIFGFIDFVIGLIGWLTTA